MNKGGVGTKSSICANLSHSFVTISEQAEKTQALGQTTVRRGSSNATGFLPHCWRKVDTPTSRATSSAFRPASSCFSAPIICASVCLLLDMLLPLSFAENHTQLCSERGDQVNGTGTLRSIGKLTTMVVCPPRQPNPSSSPLNPYWTLAVLPCWLITVGPVSPFV